MTACSCPEDWVACCRRDCIRAEERRRESREWFERYCRLVGNPTEGVSLPDGELPRGKEG